MSEIKVIRVLEITGKESWVKTVLERSYVQPGKPLHLLVGTIKELERYEDLTYRHRNDQAVTLRELDPKKEQPHEQEERRKEEVPEVSAPDTLSSQGRL